MKSKKSRLICGITILIISILAIALLCYFLLAKKMPCPFTTLGWDATLSDMKELEGTDFETYDSLYGGDTYTYPKEYLGTMGRIKYMYNQDNELMSVAWTASFEDSESMQKMYKKIYDSIAEYYGKSDNDTEEINNSGAVWHLNTGNIVLSVMDTDSNRALQYAFRSPDLETK